MITALVVAAGQGRRMGSDLAKQYLQLNGQPILVQTLTRFDTFKKIDRIFLVVPETDMAYCQYEIVGLASLKKPVTLVAGGAQRQKSVHNGLNAMGASEDIVLIHDGVRPLISEDLVNACIAGAKHYGACIPAMPVFETLKRIDEDNLIHTTVSREGLYMAQTPQAFRFSLISKAHAQAQRQGWTATDDASLVEKTGAPVHIVPGLRENLKITTPEDLAWAQAYLKIKDA